MPSWQLSGDITAFRGAFGAPPGLARQVGNDRVVRVLVPLTEARNISKPAPSGTDPDKRELARVIPEGLPPAGPRQSPGRVAPDDRGHVRGLENAIEALQEQLEFANNPLIDERKRINELLHQLADATEKGPETDPLPTIAIQTLSQAVEMLREDVAIANNSLVAERERVERSERQLEFAHSMLITERQRADRADVRVDQLLADLSDARSAERISADSAAALRQQLVLLRARPWWRRWFR